MEEYKLATADECGAVKLWSVPSGQLIHELPKVAAVESGNRFICFSPNCSSFATSSIGNTVKLWDVETYSLLMTFVGHTSRVRCVSFSPDGSRIASGSDENSIGLWDISTGTEIVTLLGHGHIISCVVFCPDGS